MYRHRLDLERENPRRFLKKCYDDTWIDRDVEGLIVATEILNKPTTQVTKRIAPRYKVLLHNDPVNTMEFVVEVLMMTIPRMDPPKAVAVMMEAHQTGVGVVIVCDLEHAEFYCEQLKSHGLTSTIEPEE